MFWSLEVVTVAAAEMVVVGWWCAIAEMRWWESFNYNNARLID
jgi:hypothetical protein